MWSRFGSSEDLGPFNPVSIDANSSRAKTLIFSTKTAPQPGIVLSITLDYNWPTAHSALILRQIWQIHVKNRLIMHWFTCKKINDSQWIYNTILRKSGTYVLLIIVRNSSRFCHDWFDSSVAWDWGWKFHGRENSYSKITFHPWFNLNNR